jgi:hypothetical protein
LSTKYSESEIHQFIKSYVKTKEGEITEQPDGIFTVTYPADSSPKEYTYEPAVARERKIPLLTPGSQAFQQILKECQENGVLCQILLNPKEGYETLVRGYFKESSIDHEEHVQNETVPCGEPPHQINNGKITSIKIVKKEPARYFQFYFSATFQNKLRPRNEETINITLDEDCNIVSAGESTEDTFSNNKAIEIVDFKSKLEPTLFDKLKTVAEEKLNAILREKLVLFDLPLEKEKKSKLRSFDKRLRRERREKVISRKHDFDVQQWHTNHEALLRREEESYITNIAVKLINLLVINTTKVKFEVTIDNNSTIRSSLILGVHHACEVTCPLCRKTFSEGYATKDSLYVCGDCTRQSVDTGNIYSKKAALSLDETLNEYFEHESGFVCAVCGKRHSPLLEFKCSHDNSSVCIHHYDFCDICGKVFSKSNLTYTDEFKRKLCPKHVKNQTKEK